MAQTHKFCLISHNIIDCNVQNISYVQIQRKYIHTNIYTKKQFKDIVWLCLNFFRIILVVSQQNLCNDGTLPFALPVISIPLTFTLFQSKSNDWVTTIFVMTAFYIVYNCKKKKLLRIYFVYFF